MIVGVKFQLCESLFNRDPQDTDLGKRIIEHSILLVEEIGIESFTFKKLAKRINSTEASIYRYFDNKHMLLLFLTSWYWEWVRYLIVINIKQIDDPKQKMKIIIENIVFASEENQMTSYVNESLLHKIVISEGAKAYHTAQVDRENKSGMFLSYKLLVENIVQVIKDYNPAFPYSTSLASNLFEMANNQIFFAEHLPRLTDMQSGNQLADDLCKMLEFFVFKLLD